MRIDLTFCVPVELILMYHFQHCDVKTLLVSHLDLKLRHTRSCVRLTVNIYIFTCKYIYCHMSHTFTSRHLPFLFAAWRKRRSREQYNRRRTPRASDPSLPSVLRRGRVSAFLRGPGTICIPWREQKKYGDITRGYYIREFAHSIVRWIPARLCPQQVRPKVVDPDLSPAFHRLIVTVCPF